MLNKQIEAGIRSLEQSALATSTSDRYAESLKNWDEFQKRISVRITNVTEDHLIKFMSMRFQLSDICYSTLMVEVAAIKNKTIVNQWSFPSTPELVRFKYLSGGFKRERPKGKNSKKLYLQEYSDDTSHGSTDLIQSVLNRRDWKQHYSE